MTEALKPSVLPIREHDLNQKAEIFTAAREFGFPVINLKTGRTGKGEGCPFKCRYCDTNKNKDQDQDENQAYWLDITESEFENTLNQWADQGGKVIEWCGDGEPSTFKWFDNLLDIVEKKGVKLEVFTNLAGLTEDRAKKLIDIDAVVKLKMDSRNPTTMGSIITSDDTDEVTTPAGARLFKNVDMLIDARDKSQDYKGQLVASIVMSQDNYKDIIEVLDWCCQKNIVPQIAYMEETGAALSTGIEILTEKQISVINRWLKIKYQIDPKQIMGDQCQAKSAPIIEGNDIFLGPFGTGCEFILREHLCEKNFIGKYKDSIQEIERSINEFRFSQKNIHAIIEELIKIRDLQGIYSQTGTDKLLPGCGDDIEELWLLEYVATNFTSVEYFNNFFEKWVLVGEHRKWTESEVNDLIDQVKQFLIIN